MKMKPPRLDVTLSSMLLITVINSKLSIEQEQSVSYQLNRVDVSDQTENFSRIEILESRVSQLNAEILKLKKTSICSPHSHKHNHHKLYDKISTSGTRRGVNAPAGAHRKQSKKRSLSGANENGRQANFFRGERGEPGKNGLDGVPGLDGAPGLDGIPGVDGRDGKDGKNGRDGVDGKDGSPGERGAAGPPGPAGEIGRRGKAGPPGKTGPPGQPGICAYKAKYDCNLAPFISSSKAIESNNGNHSVGDSENNDLQALLIAPTMIGHEFNELISEERHVTVNEGDNIQLSCEAFGQPKPSYMWHRPDKAQLSTILIDLSEDLRLTSFAGSQLPLGNVDRLQAGIYECIASNGIPPDATKRISLDVNYAPTVRLYPDSSLQRAKLGSSFVTECIVEANPSSFTYWVHNLEPIMSIGGHASELRDGAGEVSVPSQLNRHKNFIITESVGQLTTGASYSILTLNISKLSASDLGTYKCVSKNLIGQSSGQFLLEDASQNISSDVKVAGDSLDEKKSTHQVDYLDPSLGWPSRILDRHASYSVFGNNQLRSQKGSDRKKSIAGAKSNKAISSFYLPPLIYNSSESTIVSIKSNNESTNDNDNANANQSGESTKAATPNTSNPPTSLESSDDFELCKIEETTQVFGDRNDSSLILLLDQVGKPVYLGSVSERSLNWWSVDSRLEKNFEQSQTDDESHHQHYFYYATSLNYNDKLFEYNSLSDLLKDQQNFNLDSSNNQLSSRRTYNLRYPISGSSHLINNQLFFYTSVKPQQQQQGANDLLELKDCFIVAFNIKNKEEKILKFENKLQTLAKQPLNLPDDEYKLNRIELAADENGVWLILPTIEQRSTWKQPNSDNELIRRLHVVKLTSTTLATSNSNATSMLDVDYHVSMKLDWRMIGQMFIIDGVLYGIKDRHQYSSKLQFAYDLYKCKLLTTEYLIEAHRTFTNHFGNTQMIKYNSNEPKRLYTIDNGNLLWYPVKLIKTNPDDIWQNTNNSSNNNNNGNINNNNKTTILPIQANKR